MSDFPITMHFWNGPAHKIITVHWDLLKLHELVPLYKDMPCLIVGSPRSMRYCKLNYLGWKRLPKGLIPKQLLALKLILGGTP